MDIGSISVELSIIPSAMNSENLQIYVTLNFYAQEM